MGGVPISTSSTTTTTTTTTTPPPPPPTTTTTTPPTQGTTTFAPPTTTTTTPPTQGTTTFAPTQSSAAPTTQGTTTFAPPTNATLAPTQGTTTQPATKAPTTQRTSSAPTQSSVAPTTQRTTTPATKAPTTQRTSSAPTTTFFPGGNSTFNPTLPPQIGGGGSGSGGAAVGAAIGGLLVLALAVIAFVIFKTRQRVRPAPGQENGQVVGMTLNQAHASRRTSVQFPNTDAAETSFIVADLSQETRNFASSLLTLNQNTSNQYINPKEIKRITLFNLEGRSKTELKAAPLDQIEEAIRIQQDYIQALRYCDYPTTDLNGNLDKFITDYQEAFEILDSLFTARIIMETVQNPQEEGKELTGEYLQVAEDDAEDDAEDTVSVVSASGVIVAASVQPAAASAVDPFATYDQPLHVEQRQGVVSKVPVTILNPEYFTVESLIMNRTEQPSYELFEGVARRGEETIYSTAKSVLGGSRAASSFDPFANYDRPLHAPQQGAAYAGRDVPLATEEEDYAEVDEFETRPPALPARGDGSQAARQPAAALGFDNTYANPQTDNTTHGLDTYDQPLHVEQTQGVASEYAELDELSAPTLPARRGSQAARQPATAGSDPFATYDQPLHAEPQGAGAASSLYAGRDVALKESEYAEVDEFGEPVYENDDAGNPANQNYDWPSDQTTSRVPLQPGFSDSNPQRRPTAWDQSALYGSQAAVPPATASAQPPQRRPTLRNQEDAAGYSSMETLGREMRGNYVTLTQQGAGTEGQPLYDQTAPQTETIRSVDFRPEADPRNPSARQASPRLSGGRSPSVSGAVENDDWV